MSPDHGNAPDHLVELLQRVCPPPTPDPTGHPTRSEWAGYLRDLVNQIWHEGWVVGGAFVASIKPTPPRFTAEERRQFLDACDPYPAGDPPAQLRARPDVATVATTLRLIAAWGVGRPDTDDEWRSLANQVANMEPGWTCPLCQEVTCDDDCPLAAARAANP